MGPLQSREPLVGPWMKLYIGEEDGREMEEVRGGGGGGGGGGRRKG